MFVQLLSQLVSAEGDQLESELGRLMNQLQAVDASAHGVGPSAIEGFTEVHAVMISDLLSNPTLPDNTRKLVAKLTAEIAKREPCRILLTTDKTISALINLLQKLTIPTHLLEVGRALGNLCYGDNDEARMKIKEFDGPKHIVALLNAHIETGDTPSETTDPPTETTDAPSETADASTETTDAPTETTDAPTETTDAPSKTTDAPSKTTDAPSKTTDAPSDGSETESMRQLKEEDKSALQSVLLACCYNLVNNNEILQQELLRLDLFPVLTTILHRAHYKLEKHFIVILFSVLSEYDEVKKVLQTESCVKDLLRLLQVVETHNECSILELLNVALKDEFLFLVASAGVEDKLLSVLEESLESDEEEDVEMVASLADLIVRVASNDEAMKLWLAGGDGPIYKSMKTWINSSNKHLLNSAGLGLGNLARCEENVGCMIQDGTVLKALQSVMELREKIKDVDSAPRLHGLLSFLLNVAQSDKGSIFLITNNATSSLLPLLDSESFHIVGDVLGIIRKILRQPSSLPSDLSKNMEFLSKLSNILQSNVLSPAVFGESRRLVATLIKRSGQVESMVQHGLLSALGDLLETPNWILQNEAVIGLLICATATPAKECETIFDNLEVVRKLLAIFNRPSEAMGAELLCNLFLLCDTMVQSGVCLSFFPTIPQEALVRLQDHPHQVVSASAKRLIGSIQKMGAS